MAGVTAPRRDRNDPAQYDDLVDEWWRPDGDVTGTRWRYSLMNWGHDPLGDS